MNAMDILGSLLGSGARVTQLPGGQGSAAGGLGGGILEQLIKAGMGGVATQSQPAAQPEHRQSAAAGSVDIQSESRRLEELLGVATGGRSASGNQRNTPAPSHTRPADPRPRHLPQPTSASHAPSGLPPAAQPTLTTDDEALILVRALINAAKADGQVDAQEQQAILTRLQLDSEALQFLKQEFARPLDVREFAWSVPLGMEVQVYTLSLAAIELDNQQEAQYLRDLSHGLRLAPQTCNQIHARYGAPKLF
ncbi:MAG: DUF533 domain-containing protein [Pirellulaceae bacterium]|nr:DUF533 domain-containing protein [Pirellulaceae bacterium]